MASTQLVPTNIINPMGCSIQGQSGKRISLDENSPQFQLKGRKSRFKVLFHATTQEAAAQLVFSGGRLVETEGQEILFVESKERALALARDADAVVKAYVRVGVSLVVPEGSERSSLEEIRKSYPYDSLLITREETPEAEDYVVYSWSKVSIIQVRVKGVTYYEVDKEPKHVVECEASRCLYTGKSHFGSCRLQCDYERCLYFEKYHLGECALPCINNQCSRYGRCHMGLCSDERGSDALLAANILGLLTGSGGAGKPGGGQNGTQVLNSLVNIF